MLKRTSYLVVTVFVLLVRANTCTGQVQAPFKIDVIEESTSRRLRCTTLTGFIVEEAVFYRNGIRENTTDDCISNSQNGFLSFNNTPECDGLYSCGKIQNSALVLSEPTRVLGAPKAITAQAQTLSVCLGCSVNIPSNLHVSALDAQGVIWSRIIQGVTEQVQNAVINPDYSLTLADVGRGDAATYFATATNTEGKMNGPLVELTVIEKPYIVSDIVYSESDGLVQLTVTARGDDVTFEWMINNDLQNSANSDSLTTIPFPLGTTKISVNVSNSIGSDSKTMLILIQSRMTVASEPVQSDVVVSEDELCISYLVSYIIAGCFAIVLICVSVVMFGCCWIAIITITTTRKRCCDEPDGPTSILCQKSVSEPNLKMYSDDGPKFMPQRSLSETDLKEMDNKNYSTTEIMSFRDNSRC